MRTREIIGHKLQLATSEEAVVELVRDYMSCWRPEDLAQIPEACRPDKIRDGEDIADIAYDLTRMRISSHDYQPLLTEMETLFALACSRLSQLEGHCRQDDSTSEPTSGVEP